MRENNGQFGKGNRFAAGNPLAIRAGELRRELFAAVKPEDFREVVDALLRQAKQGDLVAVKELLDRLIGKSSPVEILQRLEALELSLAEREISTGHPPWADDDGDADES